MNTELLRADHPVALRHVADVLKRGGLVVFPTDTVYGLAALPFEEETVERLFAAKGRNSNRAIAILIGDLPQLVQVTSGMGVIADKLAARFWPGPLTLVVPKHGSLPAVLTQKDTVGIRMPDHPLALALLRAIGPLAVTSANMSGYNNANTAQEALEQLGGRVHLILDGGRSTGGVPSTVVDCTGSELVILRSGPLSLEDLQAALV